MKLCLKFESRYKIDYVNNINICIISYSCNKLNLHDFNILFQFLKHFSYYIIHKIICRILFSVLKYRLIEIIVIYKTE